jgi:glycosyltransferase involved in cell wall biosynthesis
MKTLILNTYDIAGGAARAAYRLHTGLQRAGIDSQLMVQMKQSNDLSVLGRKSSSGVGQILTGLRTTLDHLPLKFAANQKNITTFSPQFIPDTLKKRVTEHNPDIINLHWINSGFCQIESLAKFRKPLVWTLHDMWAFTGGCHYSQGCDRYTQSCGACPELNSKSHLDLSRWIWSRKHRSWRHLNLTVVALSEWMAACARASSLFKDTRIEIIPNGIDTNVYRPLNRSFAREVLKLPQDKKLILFGALSATSDKRKGFHLLQPALQSLSQSGWQDQCELVILGANRPTNPPDLGFPVHYLGTLADDISLVLAYSAADVFTLPSEQDNLPNTVMEAIACGTPCVGFKVGGLPDMIDHQVNGYLATPFQIDELAGGIAWVLEDESRSLNLAQSARKKVEQEFALDIQAGRYISLFSTILNS